MDEATMTEEQALTIVDMALAGLPMKRRDQFQVLAALRLLDKFVTDHKDQERQDLLSQPSEKKPNEE